MSQVLAAIVGALIAGSAAVLGAAVAARRAADHWRRDHRMAAYAELVRASRAALLHGSAQYALGPIDVPVDSEEGKASRHEWLEVVGALEAAAARITILGPSSIVALAERVSILGAESAGGDPDRYDDEGVIDQLGRAISDFSQAARGVLGTT